MSTISRVLSDPFYAGQLALTQFANLISDKKYLEWMYYLTFRKSLDLENPKSFNEKLQWMKLYDRNPLYTKLVDKLEAKTYINEVCGAEYAVPTLAVWNNENEIDLKNLPQKFVIKCNHNSGLGLIICRDKDTLDINKVKTLVGRGLRQDFFLSSREWPYRDVVRKAFAEDYLGENLLDYRFYCFNGEPKLIYVYSNLSNSEGSKPEPHFCDIMDMQWKPAPFRQKSPPKGNIPKPPHFEEMITIAKKLSRGIPYVRIDFYDLDRLYVGEFTFFPGGGFSKFNPSKWDEILGSWIELPQKL